MCCYDYESLAMKTGSTVKRQSAGKEDPVYKMGKNA